MSKAMPATTRQTVKPKPKRAEDAAEPWKSAAKPDTRVYVGDCRQLLPRVPEVASGTVDMVFADPPFNWSRDYDRWQAEHPDKNRAAYDTWHDGLPREDYLTFTYQWLDACRRGLRKGGAMWVNIPDDTAAEIAVYLKNAGTSGRETPMNMVNWCIWHYRFGQNRTGSFINSKVHAFYFVKPGGERTWNAAPILEPSDRATTYNDPRTQSKKDGMPPGMRVPMDVWYGPYWGRIQGNNAERRHGHDNQLPEVYLDRVIRVCSNEGDVVLDPFLGSGTTGTVARARGRRFIGCEYSQANAEGAWDRIINVGMIRTDPTLLNQSTAIAPKRGGGKRAKPKKA